MTDDGGHLFRFTVQSQGRYGHEDAEGEMIYNDADWWGEPWTLEVRAWSLVEALRKAAELGMNAWDMGEED